MEIDYKELLIKYIALVGSEEGVTYLYRINDDGNTPRSKAKFSEKEMIALAECNELSHRYDRLAPPPPPPSRKVKPLL